MKLLTPTVDVQDISGTENEDRSVGVVNKVPSGMIEVSTTINHEMIILDSAKEHKDDEDNNFQSEPPLKATRRSYDSRRKFQLSWVGDVHGRRPWRFLASQWLSIQLVQLRQGSLPYSP